MLKNSPITAVLRVSFFAVKKYYSKYLTAENRESFHKEPQRNTDINLVHIP